MCNVNRTIWCFLDYLNHSLPHVKNILNGVEEFDECQSDWMQSSWETLVESKLFYGTTNSLTIYGDGADVSKGSSRVCFPERVPTHKLKCICRDKKLDLMSREEIDIMGFNFEKFVKWEGDSYSVDSGLNAILLSNRDQEFVISIEDVSFELVGV